jgi:hypothetical protein
MPFVYQTANERPDGKGDTMRIEGFTIRPQDPPAGALWRFYGTREAVLDEHGNERPRPNRWELVREVRARRGRGGRYTLPDFELEPTCRDGWRFYALVIVDDEGRETWHAGEELVLTAETARALGGSVDLCGLLLWNLEREGLIAPGQLLD